MNSVFTFMDYTKADCKINLMMSIDFTVRGITVEMYTSLISCTRIPMVNQCYPTLYTAMIQIRYRLLIIKYCSVMIRTCKI